ncbi:MAG: phage tail sheath family protein [Okeania sp. SIO2B3]|nr:phage tail sheath family protein [Okeania sp. SIO2B3]
MSDGIGYVGEGPVSLSLIVMRSYVTSPNGLLVIHEGVEEKIPQITIQSAKNLTVDSSSWKMFIKGNCEDMTVQGILDKWEEEPQSKKEYFQLEKSGDGSDSLNYLDDEPIDEKWSLSVPFLLSDYKNQTFFYNKVKSEMSKRRVILPPSPSVAGVYAKVDRNRGVWKTPANVGLVSVVVPTIKIGDREQELLNLASADKSVNVIRYFANREILVWGGKTLAGVSSEWCHVSVRRLSIYVEKSLKRLTEFAVFEPNLSRTWLKVKSIAESFLEGLWRQGALSGVTWRKSFFVNVGLGTTMTKEDVLEGRINVEIGIAVIRPLEFIILKFSHKLQQM